MSDNLSGKLVRHDLPTNQAEAGNKLLSSSSVRDLGGELLARLRRPQDHASQGVLEAHLATLVALYETIEPLIDVQENRSSVAILAGQFQFVHHCWKNFGLPLQDAVHVDIGCGPVNPFSRIFSHIMAGVRRGWCIEMDPLHDPSAAVSALARIAGAALVDPGRLFGVYPIQRSAILTNLAGFDLGKMRRGDTSGMDASRLEFLQRPIEATGIPSGAVDVVISNSVLEHLPDVDSAIAELARITRPGGFAIHGIDIIDHRTYTDPGLHALEFLTIDSRDRIVHGCNRLRFRQFEECFARHGFTVVERWPYNRVAIPASLRARLVEPWRSMSDAEIDTTWTQYLIRRNGAVPTPR